MGIAEKELAELVEFAQWDYQKGIVSKDEYLSETEKQATIKAIEKIGKVLGQNFLEKSLRTGHPIFNYLVNTAPWTRHWLKELGDMFTAFQTSQHFNELCKKLEYTAGFLSGMSELEIAYRLHKHGLTIGFYPRTGSRYICDFQAQKDDSITYFEVSNIEWSEEKRKSMRTFDEIALTPYNIFEVETAGKIYKTLSSPRIQEIKKRINYCVEKAKKEQKVVVLCEPGIIDFIVAPRNLSAEVSKWRIANGMKNCSWQGPPCNFDELVRIRKTFRDENRQLPKDSQGVIALYENGLYGEGRPEFYSALSYAIEEEIYDHSNLIAGAVVFPDATDSSPAGCYSPSITWSRRTRLDMIGENTLVIRNKYSKFSIDEEIIRALIV
jgi:hypothetical protein